MRSSKYCYLKASTDAQQANSLTDAPLLKGPKRQHTVPAAYLRGFCQEGLLAVFDRVTRQLRIQQPSNTACIGHFYTVVDDEGRQRFEIEQVLSEIEGAAAPALEKLAQPNSQLSEDERSDLAVYLACAATRTPLAVNRIKDFESGLIKDFTRNYFSDVATVAARLRKERGPGHSDSAIEIEARGLVEFAQSDGYRVTIDHAHAVRMSMGSALGDIAELLHERHWTVLHSPDDGHTFLTSDVPLVLTTVAPRRPSPYGIGFGNNDALVIFPVNAKTLLLAFGTGAGLLHQHADRETMRRINLASAKNSDRFVIGRDQRLVESVARANGWA